MRQVRVRVGFSRGGEWEVSYVEVLGRVLTGLRIY